MKTKFFAIIACLFFVLLLCQISYAQFGCYGPYCFGPVYGFPGYSGYDYGGYSFGCYGPYCFGSVYGFFGYGGYDYSPNVNDLNAYCEETYGPGSFPVCSCDEEDISTCECQCVY